MRGCVEPVPAEQLSVLQRDGRVPLETQQQRARMPCEEDRSGDHDEALAAHGCARGL